MSEVFDHAWDIAVAVIGRGNGPFGLAETPGYTWHVSWDVMQALTEAAPPPQPIPNPKTAEGLTKLLFGRPLVVDERYPRGWMTLTDES